MSWNNGAGSPNHFRCSKCILRGRYRGIAHVHLTGRSRVKGSAPGARSSRLSREYTCTICGHTGWSNHMDLARKTQWAVEIRYSADDKLERRIYCASERQASKVEDGVLINLNYERFYVEVVKITVPEPSNKRAGREVREEGDR